MKGSWVFDFHSLVCRINQIALAKADSVNINILIIKSVSVQLSPLTTEVKER